MTTTQLHLFNGLYLVLLIVAALLTRATPRRIAGAVAGGMAVGVMVLGVILLGERTRLWHFALRWDPYFLLLMYLDLVISMAAILLVTWRLARRYGKRGFTILLVVGNTMAQAVRERTSELAVLKTLGFSNATVLALVLAESLFIAVAGGGLGLLAAWAIVWRGDPTGGLLTPFVLPNRDLVVGLGLMLAVGVAAGLFLATGAMRLRIVDALRKA